MTGKILAVVVLAVSLGFVLREHGLFSSPASTPAPPALPPPPAILNEPAPVIDAAELQKVRRSALDTDPNVRWETVVFLDKIKSAEAMPLMQEMLQRDMDAGLRTKIIGLLSDRKGPDVLNALVGAMRDQEPDVRIAALRALEKIGDFSVAPAIANGPIRDQDERVRLQAMKTLNSLQDQRQREIDEARARYEREKAAAAGATKK